MGIAHTYFICYNCSNKPYRRRIMKRKIFSLAIVLTFILCMSVIFVACDDNEDSGTQYPINASMTFNMDGVDYTYELTDDGETQTFNIKYGTNTIAYDVVKIGEHYYVCGGVADFIYENGELKIYSIGNAVDFITPRSYHVGTHTIDGQSITLKEDGTFVTASGNQKYYVVDGNKLIVPNSNGTGVVYSKTVGEYVKDGVFYGNDVFYPDTAWKNYNYEYFADNVERRLSMGATKGKYIIVKEDGESEWYYGDISYEGDYVLINAGNKVKKLSIDTQNQTFDEAHKILTDGESQELRIYENGTAILKSETEGLIYEGKKVDFDDNKNTIEVTKEEEKLYYVYDKSLPEIMCVKGDGYIGLPSTAKKALMKGKENSIYYFVSIGDMKVAYMPLENGYAVCKYEKSFADERIYSIERNEIKYMAFVDGDYIYMNSDVSVDNMNENKAELATATDVTEYKWTITEEMKSDLAGTVEFTTYTIDGFDKCVIFIYNAYPTTEESSSSVITNLLACASYTVTTEGDVKIYEITTSDNYVYTLKVQNNEIIEADYTW